MQYLTPNLLEAFEFAAVAHGGQVRKGPENIPYFSHPAVVALILAKAGFSEEVVIAGVLHDVVEDTKHSIEEISEKFGKRVAELVMGVTEDERLKWKERKQKYNEKIKQADREVKAISAADLIANRQSRLKFLRQGLNPWKYFDDNTDYEKRVMANDAERLECIKSGLDHPMVAELEALLAETNEITNELLRENF